MNKQGWIILALVLVIGLLGIGYGIYQITKQSPFEEQAVNIECATPGYVDVIGLFNLSMQDMRGLVIVFNFEREQLDENEPLKHIEATRAAAKELYKSKGPYDQVVIIIAENNESGEYKLIKIYVFDAVKFIQEGIKNAFLGIAPLNMDAQEEHLKYVGIDDCEK